MHNQELVTKVLTGNPEWLLHQSPLERLLNELQEILDILRDHDDTQRAYLETKTVQHVND
jgi:hypothetical protein